MLSVGNKKRKTTLWEQTSPDRYGEIENIEFRAANGM